MTLAADPALVSRLYRQRFPEDLFAGRAGVWRVLVDDFFQHWVHEGDIVLDLGCGFGEFINSVRCHKRIAVDLNEDTRDFLRADVEFHQGPVHDLAFLADASVDVVFSSNVLEHLVAKAEVEQTLSEVRRVLRPGGSLQLLGPNARYLGGEYWDFWDHHIPITDRSLVEILNMHGFEVVQQVPRFLPYTTRSALPTSAALVRYYLRLPLAWRFFGRQFFIRACVPEQPVQPLISIVLPVYNEGENIQTCLRRLSRALTGIPHEILVCYDFEADTTPPAIFAMPDRPSEVRLVRNRLGAGVAHALKAGFKSARGDVVVTTMADLSDPPEVIQNMAAKIRNDGAAVVSGSRYMTGGRQEGAPRLKSTLSRLAGLSLYYLAGVGTHDATTNFRAYKADFLRAVTVQSRMGFEVALELTTKAHLLGYRVAEVPSTWTERSAGASHFRLAKWMPAYLAWYIRALAAPAIVWGSWAVSTILAVTLLLRYFPSIPYWDDWNNVLFAESQSPVTLQWLWDFHVDHRIPIPRLAYLALYRLSNHDVRIVMFANIAILSLTAVFAIIAARRLFGRTRVTDVVLPLSLAGLVNYNNMFWGFQIAFILTTATFCCIVYLVLRRRTWFNFSTVGLVGLCALALILIDSAGLILTLPIVAVLTMMALTRWRSRNPAVVRTCWFSLAIAVAWLGVFSGYNLFGHASPMVVPLSGPRQLVNGALQFAAVAIAAPPVVTPPQPASGFIKVFDAYFTPAWVMRSSRTLAYVIIAIGALPALALARQLLRRRDFFASGPLACLAAPCLLGLAIGYSRGDAFVARYATLGVTLIVSVYLCLAMQRNRLATIASWALLVPVVFLWPWNAYNALTFAQTREAFARGFENDVRAGMPAVLLGTKYFEDVWFDSQLATDVIRRMPEYHIGPFRDSNLQLNDSDLRIVAERSLSTIPTSTHNMTLLGEYWQGQGPDSNLQFSTGPVQLAGVRVKYRLTNPRHSPALLQIAWSDPPRTNFEQKGNRFVRWGAPADGQSEEVTAWIGDRVTSLQIIPDLESSSYAVDEIVLLLGDPPSDGSAVSPIQADDIH